MFLVLQMYEPISSPLSTINGVLITFLVAMTKYLTWNNIREKGFISVYDWRGYSPSWQGSHSSSIAFTVRKQRAVDAHSQIAFSFYAVWDLSPRYHLQLGWVLFTSVNIDKLSQTCPEVIFLVILDPVMLTALIITSGYSTTVPRLRMASQMLIACLGYLEESWATTQGFGCQS